MEPERAADDPTAAPRARRVVRGLLLGLLAAHLLIVVARIPRAAWSKRLDELEAHQRLGRPRYLLEGAHLGGADVVEEILAETPPDCAVLFDGRRHEAMEFVPALLFPRLVVGAGSVDPAARHAAGRRLATRRDADGRERQLVIVGLGDALEVRLR